MIQEAVLSPTAFRAMLVTTALECGIQLWEIRNMDQQTINLSGIAWESVVDGPGLRAVLFAQGCRHGCPGCFNEDLQPFRDAQWYPVNTLMDELKQRPYLDGVTFSGGDPLEQADAFSTLAAWCQEQALDVWCYTGYRWEELADDERIQTLLNHVNVLVDGRYEATNSDRSLMFRGSANQRLIRVQESRQRGQLVLWQT